MYTIAEKNKFDAEVEILWKHIRHVKEINSIQNGKFIRDLHQLAVNGSLAAAAILANSPFQIPKFIEVERSSVFFYFSLVKENANKIFTSEMKNYLTHLDKTQGAEALTRVADAYLTGEILPEKFIEHNSFFGGYSKTIFHPRVEEKFKRSEALKFIELARILDPNNLNILHRLSYFYKGHYKASQKNLTKLIEIQDQLTSLKSNSLNLLPVQREQLDFIISENAKVLEKKPHTCCGISFRR